MDVNEIIFEQKKAIGVKTNNKKEFFADKIVLNCDPAYAYKYLIKKKNKWNQRKIDKLDYSMGLFVIYFGTKKKNKNICPPYNMDGQTI